MCYTGKQWYVIIMLRMRINLAVVLYKDVGMGL